MVESAAPPPARGQPVKPALEALEERAVLSTASLTLHAVTDAFNNSAVFYLNPQDQGFYEHDAYHGTRELAGPGLVQAFSAGVDNYGVADVFAKASVTSFWEYNNNIGWHKILGPNVVGSFAAVKGDRVYFQTWDNALWLYGSNVGFYEMAAPNSVLSIDAVTDGHGNDAVFALGTDHSFGEYHATGYFSLAPAYTIQPGFSAGFGINGNADVFGLDSAGEFCEFDNFNSFVWRVWPGTKNFTEISATSYGIVYALGSDGHLIMFDENGRGNGTYFGDITPPGSSFGDISAAGPYDLYTITPDNTGWERTGGGLWMPFAASGPVF